VEAMLDDGGYVEKKEGSVMLVRDFKTILDRYCSDNDTPRPVGRMEDVCNETFHRKGITLCKKVSNVEIDGVMCTNVDIIVGLAKVLHGI
jgi:hypothetical protein